MSIRIVAYEVNQDSHDIEYARGMTHRVLLGPKKITLHLESDEHFPSPTPLTSRVGIDGVNPFTVHALPSLDEWFVARILPTLPPEMLRRIVADATAQLLIT